MSMLFEGQGYMIDRLEIGIVNIERHVDHGSVQHSFIQFYYSLD